MYLLFPFTSYLAQISGTLGTGNQFFINIFGKTCRKTLLQTLRYHEKRGSC